MAKKTKKKQRKTKCPVGCVKKSSCKRVSYKKKRRSVKKELISFHPIWDILASSVATRKQLSKKKKPIFYGY